MRPTSSPVSLRAVVLLLLITAAGRPAAGGFPQQRDVPADGTLMLVPSPRSIERHPGSFVLGPAAGVLIGRRNDPDDRFAVTQLKDEIRELHGLTLRDRKSLQGKDIVVGRLEQDGVTGPLLPQVSRVLLDSLGAEGYVLHITPSRIVVAAKSGAGVFYGVQTLRQLIRANADGKSIPCVTVIDWPRLAHRGVMLDISRGPIPTMAYLKEIIATLAAYKQNMVTLYTEHVFRLRSHPDVAPADGITREQVAELTAWARQHHCDLIGNAQPFGHMEHTLAIPFYRPMAENPWVISPAVEGTYDYLKDVLTEIVPAYESPFFHINADEVTGLGEGPARRMVDSMGQGGVYAYHIGRIAEIIRPYNKRLLMWGDIAVNNPEIIDRLPKDLIVVSWGYHRAESFDDAILPFTKTGFDFMVAPGVNCWGNVWPNMSVATLNISNYVRDGAALGTMGMMNTVWVDDGENLGAYNWHGLIWGAECSWSPARPLKGVEAQADLARRSAAFDRAFDALFFGTGGVSSTFSLFDSLRSLPVRGIVTDPAVWSSMLEIYPEEVDDRAVLMNERVVREAAALLATLEERRDAARWHREVIDAACFAARRVLFTGRKNLVRADLARTMRVPSAGSVGTTRERLGELFHELHALKKEYAGLWDRENRPWWRDRVLAKYDRLGAQLLDLDKTVIIEEDTLREDGRHRIVCRTPFADQEIRFTTDGSEPTVRSAVYTTPVPIDHPALIRARVFTGKQAWPMAEKFFLIHKGVGRIVRLGATYSTYDPAYAAGGPMGLADGLRGSENFKDGRWQGFQGQDLEVVLDLKARTALRRISIGFLQSSYSWILMPERVQFWVSDDGREYTLVQDVPTMIDPRAEGTVLHEYAAVTEDRQARYVKIIAVSPGKLPSWHHAAGGDAFMFADEIVVE